MIPVVDLVPAEIVHGTLCGTLRRDQGLRSCQGRNGLTLTPPDAWAKDINAALAELAVAKYLRRYWEGLATLGVYDGDDVAGGVGVRWRSEDFLDLPIHKADRDDAPFVLVTGRTPSFALRGWIVAGDAKQQRYWNKGSAWPAFFIPQADLRDMSTLRDFLEGNF